MAIFLGRSFRNGGLSNTTMNARYLFFLLLLSAACRRPSKQLGATLTPTSKPSQTVSSQSRPALVDYSRNLRAGDELVATGTEPFWSLSINPSKNMMRFKALSGDSINTPIPQRIDDSNGTVRFNAEVESGRLTVLFRPDSCVNAMSGQRADYRVELTHNGKSYVGCGVSLRQLTLLNDIWVLQTLNGKEVKTVDQKSERPRLEIQLTQGRVTGTTGCNRLTGPVKADTRQIQVGPLAVTRMACLNEAGRLEGDFLEALSQPLTYQVGEGKLILLRDGKTVMMFKKVD